MFSTSSSNSLLTAVFDNPAASKQTREAGEGGAHLSFRHHNVAHWKKQRSGWRQTSVALLQGLLHCPRWFLKRMYSKLRNGHWNQVQMFQEGGCFHPSIQMMQGCRKLSLIPLTIIWAMIWIPLALWCSTGSHHMWRPDWRDFGWLSLQFASSIHLSPEQSIQTMTDCLLERLTLNKQISDGGAELTGSSGYSGFPCLRQPWNVVSKTQLGGVFNITGTLEPTWGRKGVNHSPSQQLPQSDQLLLLGLPQPRGQEHHFFPPHTPTHLRNTIKRWKWTNTKQ